MKHLQNLTSHSTSEKKICAGLQISNAFFFFFLAS